MMKKGLSLTELAAEIERRENSKRDFLASTSAMDVAVGHFGFEAFDSWLAPIIASSSVEVANYVGCSTSPLPADGLHNLAIDIRVVDGREIIAVRIKLFAFLDAPTYEVAVGPLRPPPTLADPKAKS